MNDAQVRAIKEALEIIKSCTVNIRDCCTKDIAPDDPIAKKDNEMGNFPSWLPNNLCDMFDQIWDLSGQIKQTVKRANAELEKVNVDQ